MNKLKGIHHITAVSAAIAQNAIFYTKLLGMRLVKKSVNQDDVSAYHLFYADKHGTPGTDMTFFDWPRMRPEQRGTDSIVGTAFRVNGTAALEYWAERLVAHGIVQGGIQEFAGRSVLPFEDPEGQRLYLVDDGGADYEGELWQVEGIPEEFALRGFYSVVLSIPFFEQLGPVLTDIMQFTETERTTWLDGETEVAIYQTGDGDGAGREIWLLEEPELRRARQGAGATHHVAFRVADEAEEKEWREHLQRSGLMVSHVIDRFWFRSIYYRVSMGILFEIATDGPGFTVDEDLEALGETLVLPPFLEARRREIEAGLIPIAGA